MKKLKPQAEDSYCNLIASIANNAISKVSGVTKEVGLVKYKFGLTALKDRNVHVFIDGSSVIIDMFVNVDFGHSVPEVVCALQEQIKNDVEDATMFIVKKINVTVANINL